jgi:hypothetical protein
MRHCEGFAGVRYHAAGHAAEPDIRNERSTLKRF